MNLYKLIIKLLKAVKKFTISLILKAKNFRASESIIIFGEARGGSTWLMEMLNETLDVCINWEPLHVRKGVIPRELNFGWRPFIPKDTRNETYFFLFKKIHEYKIYSNWTTSYIKPLKLIQSKHVLVKYVRANMLVPYLLKNFKFKYKPIFLIRHPIDTCLSQMKTFEKDDNNITKFEVPNCINNERYIKHLEFINNLKSKLEVKIATWCINNCDTINQIDNYDTLYVIFYSDLLFYPEEELKAYLNKNQLKSYIKKLNQVNYRKASSADFDSEYRNNVNEQLFKNFDMLDDIKKEKIQKIFDYFEFRLFTAYSPYPNKQYLVCRNVSGIWKANIFI
ncbi:MAG: hypothetical protein U5L09_12930 [Bacteroidales bacterium]|nr:hypothetical protein [Bacteroidales bacterium]